VGRNFGTQLWFSAEEKRRLSLRLSPSQVSNLEPDPQATPLLHCGLVSDLWTDPFHSCYKEDVNDGRMSHGELPRKRRVLAYQTLSMGRGLCHKRELDSKGSDTVYFEPSLFVLL
jgi:hypothetical protein